MQTGDLYILDDICKALPTSRRPLIVSLTTKISRLIILITQHI